MPTHFDGPDGKPVAIETYVHLPSAHMDAASSAGFAATELREALIDDDWIQRKPKWARRSRLANQLCLGVAHG